MFGCINRNGEIAVGKNIRRRIDPSCINDPTVLFQEQRNLDLARIMAGVECSSADNVVVELEVLVSFASTTVISLDLAIFGVPSDSVSGVLK